VRLLLISNSTAHGGGYLDHCAGAITDVLAASVRTVLFVPYALHDHDGYAERVRQRMRAMGFDVVSVHDAGDGPRRTVERAEAIFIGGGNTFRLVDALWRHSLIDPIGERVRGGAPYIGISAGLNVACPTIRTTNDMPIVQPPSFDALGLVPFQINPHYQDSDPGSTHMGETREQRIAEFLEENTTPVVGLRENSWIRVNDSSATLAGARRARLFRRGEAPVEYEPGARLDFLLG